MATGGVIGVGVIAVGKVTGLVSITGVGVRVSGGPIGGIGDGAWTSTISPGGEAVGTGSGSSRALSLGLESRGPSCPHPRSIRTNNTRASMGTMAMRNFRFSPIPFVDRWDEYNARAPSWGEVQSLATEPCCPH